MGSMGALTPSNLEMHQDLLRGSLPRHGEAPVGAAMAGPPGQFMNLLLPVQPKPAVRLSNEERLSRMRERNRMHARKTRQRKKLQMKNLQQQVDALKSEGEMLRHHIFDFYTANVLLQMSGQAATDPTPQLSKLEEIVDRESAKREPGAGEGDAQRLEMTADGRLKDLAGPGEADADKPKRRGKYTPEERERVRRERNRMHAKRTRDRKKMFLEESEHLIKRLRTDNSRMRSFLEVCGVDVGAAPPPPPPPQQQQQDTGPADAAQQKQPPKMFAQANFAQGGSSTSSVDGTTNDGGDSDDSCSTAGPLSPKR